MNLELEGARSFLEGRGQFVWAVFRISFAWEAHFGLQVLIVILDYLLYWITDWD